LHSQLTSHTPPPPTHLYTLSLHDALPISSPVAAPHTSGVELRDLPSVDELARGVDDPLAVDAARAVLERAREEIRSGAEPADLRSEEHTSELQSRSDLVCRLLLEKKKNAR